MKGLTFKIKALKQQAVFRFASAYNAKQHDEARAKNPPPHPNKLGFTKPLNMLGHLKFLLESERGEDLSLRRFSPLDYSMKLSGPVECPFEGCGFQTDLGKTMISHQQEVRHPGWNRHDTTREGQSKPWHCGLRTCQKAFPTWDGCYKHMQSHSKPLACPVCESFRTDRMPRLKKHLKEVHGQQNVGSGHFSRKSGSKFLAK